MRRIRIDVLAAIAFVVLAWRAAESQTADVNAIITRAVRMQNEGDYASAADLYGEALKLRPNDVATHVNRGVVLVKLGRFDRAIAEYQTAERLLPGDRRIELNIALAYEKSGRLRDAVSRLESLHAANPEEIQVTMLLADGQLQLGDDRRVIELLQPIEAEKREDLSLAYMLGTALLHEQRIQEGQVMLDRILRNGDTAEAHFLLGTRMFEARDYPAAVKEFASAIALNPNLPQLEAFYGEALLETGDAQAAVAAFRKELATNASDYRSNLALAEILNVRKQFEEATALARRALLLRPDSADARLALAQGLRGTGQPREARSYAEAAARSMPKSFEAHENLAAVYEALGLTADAKRESGIARRLKSAADPGPKVNEPAPEFTLTSISTGKQVALRDYRGRSPVVLVFGSYSCPNFRASAEALRAMYRRFGSSVPFLLVYVREAHAEGDWQSTRNERDDVEVAPAKTLAEKQEHASMCSRKLHLPFPAIADGMDGQVEKRYNAWPSRAFVIDRAGRVVYCTRLTEFDFDQAEMESALRSVGGGKT